MKTYRIYYNDETLDPCKRERFSTYTVYPGPRAREVADALASMGCSEFTFVAETDQHTEAA